MRWDFDLRFFFTQRLEFHRLSPEFRFDPNVLPKFKIGRRGVASADWRVVTHLGNDDDSSYATPKHGETRYVYYLLTNILEAFVFADALVGFAQQGIKRLVTCAYVRGPVRRYGKGGNQHHPFIRVLGFRSLVQQFAVLQLFAKTLQHALCVQ